jgi:hypothetical protein
MLKMVKYPRTQHLEGSRLQAGDEDLSGVRFAEVKGMHLVVEEKIDGANAGIRFDASGKLHLQSRGHFLAGGPREKHFNLFKQWAMTLAGDLFDILSDRYVLYGEWLYAKHTVYYDALPHYFMEFDILDLEREEFLSTPRRREMLDGLAIASVPVLHEGEVATLDDLTAFVRPSLYKTANWREAMARTAVERGIDPSQAAAETDGSDLAEGLYIKAEAEGKVVGRYKWVRHDFLNAIMDSGTHWLRRPVLPNGLADGADLFGGGE